jgi:GDPmannose 4,6-dehydratase
MASTRRAFVSGIRGQDGPYAARALARRGFEVFGGSRDPKAGGNDRELRDVNVVAFDPNRAGDVEHVLREWRPEVVVNLAARASSAHLFDDPLATTEVNGVAVVRWLEGIRRLSPETRFVQASSSEVFGIPAESPQRETTPIRPLNAYGCAKAFADHCVAAFRHAHRVFACAAILFPHESERRSAHFLIPKVVRAAVDIAAGKADHVMLGDLRAIRDWGYAPDYADAMVRMAVAEQPADYVVATGVAHSVADACRIAFECVGLDFRNHVRTDPTFVRPVEPVTRVGDASRLRALLGWEPSVSFESMIELMVRHYQSTGERTE